MNLCANTGKNAADAHMLRCRSFVNSDLAVVVDERDGVWPISYRTSIRAKLIWYSDHDEVTENVKVRNALVVFLVVVGENRVESPLGHVAPV